MRFQLSTEFIKRVITGTILGVGFWITFAYFPPLCFSLILLLIMFLIILFELTFFFSIKNPLFWVLLLLYVIIPFGLLISLNHTPLYHDLLYLLFILVFSFDTGSYIVGSTLGKHHICKAISPKKTWEGSLAGYLFAYMGCIFIFIEQGYKLNWPLMAILTLITSTLALAGDLFESILKRRAGIKDSGTLLPGHGGFLDRFDGIIFAVFFFYLFKDKLIFLLIK